MPLTPKQQRFVEEDPIDLNATQAAIRAGYSERTANQAGPRVLVNVGVAAALRRVMAEHSERAGVDADLVIKGLMSIAEDPEANAGARVSAWAVLAKHTGVIADGSTVHVGGDHRQIHVHLDGGPRDQPGGA